MDKVNIHEAKTHFSKLVERVHNGEEIIVAKTGVPYARLVPLEKKEAARSGSLEGTKRIRPIGAPSGRRAFGTHKYMCAVAFNKCITGSDLIFSRSSVP